MTTTTSTGRRGLDIALFCAIVLAMVTLSPRLRVYYSVTVIEATVARLGAAGGRTVVPTPPELRQIEEGYTGAARILPVLERAADRQMVRFAEQRADPAGTRYEFTFRYGFDTIRLTESHVVLREVTSVGP